MKSERLTHATMGGALVVLGAACGSSGPATPGLTVTSINAWDAGPEAGCVIAASGVHVGCATAYPITGNPYACSGFDDAGSGSTAACQTTCSTGLVCSVVGLSNGMNAVDCAASCASPEH